MAASRIPKPGGNVVSGAENVLRVQGCLDSGQSVANFANDNVDIVAVIISFAIQLPEDAQIALVIILLQELRRALT